MKRQINRINFIYIFSYLGDALFSPFLALYFSSINIGEYQKGILLALIPFSSLVGNLIYGKLSNSAKKNLMILRILLIFNLIPMFLMGLVKNYILIAILTIVFAFHNNAFFQFQDGIAVNISSFEKTIYSNTRVLGTIGYFIGSLVGGYLIDLTNYTLVFIIAALIYTFVEYMFIFVKPYDQKMVQNQEISFKQLFLNKQFVYYLVFYILVLGNWSIQEAYVSLFFEKDGIGVSLWGYVYAFEILIEALTIFIINRYFRKFGYKNILLVAISLMILRSGLLSLEFNVYVKLISTCLIRGIAWGSLLSSHIEMMKKMIGETLITKGVLTLSVITNIYVTMGNYFAPYIYTNLNFELLYLFLALIQLIGLIVYVIFIYRLKIKME